MDTVTLSSQNQSITMDADTFERAALVVRVPHPATFDDSGFMYAPTLNDLATDLATRYPELAPCLEAKIKVYWKAKGGGPEEMPTVGKCSKASGITALESGADYVIWLAADHLASATQDYIEAALYHELCHVTVEYDKNDEPKLKVRRHDAELFVSEVERYGLWRQGLASAGKAMQQALFDLEPAD